MSASAATAGRTGLPVTTVAHLRHPLGRGETQRQPVGIPRQEAIGAAQHRVLLVQDHRRPMPHQSRGEHRRDTGIAAEADHRGGMDARQDPPRLRTRHRPATAPPCPRAAAPRPAIAGAADHEVLEAGEHRALQSARAGVGHQRHAPAARQQLARQRFGREEMAAGAAGRDHDREAPRDPSWHVAMMPAARQRQQHAHAEGNREHR